MENNVEMYGLKDVESILNLTRPTLLKYCNNGTIPAVKVGSRWRVSKKALEEYIEKHSNSNR